MASRKRGERKGLSILWATQSFLAPSLREIASCEEDRYSSKGQKKQRCSVLSRSFSTLHRHLSKPSLWEQGSCCPLFQANPHLPLPKAHCSTSPPSNPSNTDLQPPSPDDVDVRLTGWSSPTPEPPTEVT